MFGRYRFLISVAALSAAFIIVCMVPPLHAYRVCTFKGVVVGHGWRTMTVKSGSQCAEVNVGWRTKYIPNRRPCLGERVAVDFTLEDGYMKATKVVSLSPLPPSVQCYPPPPPSSAVCREVGEARASVESCVPPRAVCSTRPPSYVTGKWHRAAKPPAVKRPRKLPKHAKATKPAPEKEPAKPTPPPPPATPTITGEVVASNPQSLSVRVMEEGQAAEVMNIKVTLKTKFIPFRRPAVGEKVKVEYRQENGSKFAKSVTVVQ
jgi:hypothetical protein